MPIQNDVENVGMEGLSKQFMDNFEIVYNDSRSFFRVIFL